jgi:phospholipase C
MHFRASVASICLSMALVCSAPAQSKSQPAQNPEQNNGPQHPSGDMTVIQHIVFIMKENRSFDNYFGTFPGANGATSAPISTGQTINLGHTPDATPRDIAGHGWYDYSSGYDNGKIDMFDVIPGGSINEDYLSLTQLQQQDLPNYWTYAQKFVLADNAFSSLRGASLPNHLYMVGAQSGGDFLNPLLGAQTPNYWGCDAPAATYARVSDPQTGLVTAPFPCWDFQTLADSLENAGVSWKFYAPPTGTSGYTFNTLDAINHIRNGPLWATNVVNTTEFITDVQNGNLPSVSWVTMGSPYNEHPPESTCVGENWTVTQLNALMASPEWATTAVFIAWDDFGGFYDHVPPPTEDFFGLGGRVPFLIISPYAQAGYISNTQYEFSSVLKFIEERFGLPPLTNRDAVANDTTDSFNFSQTPLNPVTLGTRSCPFVDPNVYVGGQTVGKPSPTTVLYLVNNSNTKMTLTSVTASGPFTEKNNCPTSIPVGQKCTLDITFKPTAIGPASGTVTIKDSDPTSPQTINLTGVGIATEFSAITNFGSLYLGTTAAKTVTVTNTQSTALTLNTISTKGPYTQTNNCGSVLSGNSSCTITVNFNPVITGTTYGGLSVQGSDALPTLTVDLEGTGQQIEYKPTNLTFPSTAVGKSSAPKIVTITAATIPLSVGTISTTGAFSETNTCPATLAANASCTVSVVFTPTASGTNSGTLSIISDDPNSPESAKLTGTGTT